MSDTVGDSGSDNNVGAVVGGVVGGIIVVIVIIVMVVVVYIFVIHPKRMYCIFHCVSYGMYADKFHTCHRSKMFVYMSYMSYTMIGESSRDAKTTLKR